ncbi:MAG: tRNA pseudouridine synthase [Candidatus Parcubacteria bacterium]|jgi:tRNA pseudouridine55 synthase
MQPSDWDKEILLIDKPEGITSFDVIRRIKRMMKDTGIVKLPKIGHGGTLDPMATGLMIIGIGKGTKKLNDYLKLDKTYEAEIALGIRTDTSDITGNILESISDTEIAKLNVNQEKVQEVLKSLEGEIELPVSVYSALKRSGKRLYEYAREGKIDQVEIPIRKMMVHKAVYISFDNNQNKIKAAFDVGSGTYIRSLAEEIGKRLGTVATLSALRRSKVGQFEIGDAKQLN